MDEDRSLPTTKSVYEVFDKAKTTNVFMETRGKLHSQLHGEYSSLCQDVHTADVAHMASITALKHFPSFNKKEAESISKMVQRIIPIYITAIALKYNRVYHSMSFAYKENNKYIDSKRVQKRSS